MTGKAFLKVNVFEYIILPKGRITLIYLKSLTLNNVT